MANGHQKPDHGGNFFMTPRKLLNSVAWRSLSNRARVILLLFQSAHDGFNNGRIKMGIHQIGSLIGNQNHTANSEAVAELIQTGFLECVSDANHQMSKVREYRITFISTGAAKKIAPATNEYLDWLPRPGAKRKFGGVKSATENAISIADAATSEKFSLADSATLGGGNAGISTPGCVAVAAPILGNHSSSLPTTEISAGKTQSPGEAICVDLHELREWARAVVDLLGYGGQKALATDAGVPQPVLCKFMKGRGLPSSYRYPLQMACARRVPFIDLKAVLAA